jgi:hypothetical protein
MRLRLLLLSGTTTTATGVDLDTRGLRRIQWREDAPVFAPYDVVEAQGLPSDDLPFPSDMTWAVDPVLVGRLRGRKAEKVVRPLVHRGSAPLLGAATPSVTYWTLGDAAPSVSLVDPAAGPVVERDWNHHLRCRFRAGRLDHDLPLEDPGLEERLSHPTATRLAGGTLARALGWSPERLVVALTAPEDGRCHKVVAGLVPRP